MFVPRQIDSIELCPDGFLCHSYFLPTSQLIFYLKFQCRTDRTFLACFVALKYELAGWPFASFVN